MIKCEKSWLLHASLRYFTFYYQRTSLLSYYSPFSKVSVYFKTSINCDQFMAESDQNLEGSVERTNFHGSAWWVLLAIILLTAFIRYGLLDVPLERDEGEYAYGGQLILQGVPLYQQLYSMKLPGIYAAYAFVLAIFGQTHTGIHFGLLIINAATIILVFFLTKRMIDSLAAAVAAASFAVLSVGQSVQGPFANAEHFVILPVVGGGVAFITCSG